MPFPAGTWLAVVRRAIVVAALLAIGFLTGEVAFGVGAAFGALQMGLMEAAVPGRRLAWLLVINVIVLSGVAFLGSFVGGTWWSVVLLVVLAYIQGSTGGAGMIPGDTAIGALSIAVLFTAVPRAPEAAAQAAAWVAVGAGIQALGWAIVWRLDRKLSIRRSMANSIRDVVRMLEVDDRRMMTTASQSTDHALGVLDGSGIVGDSYTRAHDLIDAIGNLRRSVITWLVIARPGFAERHNVSDRLGQLISRIADAQTGRQERVVPPLPTDSGWLCVDALLRDLAKLEAAVESYRQPAGKESSTAGVELAQAAANPHELPATLKALLPRSGGFRHGVRMAIAIGLAQTFTLLAGIPHSFWITITVVFVLKSDWSTTAVKSVGRVIGNLLAVTLVPLVLMLTLGVAWAIVLVVFLLAIVMYRYFTGNYIYACLGLAGTVLALDEQLGTNADLYAERIVATLVGVVVAVVVSLLIPTWRSASAPSAVTAVVAALGDWLREIMDGDVSGSTEVSDPLQRVDDRARRQLITARAVAEGALVEPRRRGNPLLLMEFVDAAERFDVGLLALASYKSAMPEPTQLLSSEDAGRIAGNMDRAAVALKLDAAPVVNPFLGERVVNTDEQLAVTREALAMDGASDSIADVCETLRSTHSQNEAKEKG